MKIELTSEDIKDDMELVIYKTDSRIILEEREPVILSNEELTQEILSDIKDIKKNRQSGFKEISNDLINEIDALRK